MLDLSDEIVADIVQFLDRPMRGRLGRHRQQPIVSLSLTVFRLLRFDDTDHTRWNDASRGNRSVHQDKDIKRVAIVAKRRGDEPKIEWEHGSRWQDAFEDERPESRFKRQLVRGSFRSFDHDKQIVKIISTEAVQ